MAAFDTTRATYGATSRSGLFGAGIGNFIGIIAAWNDARATRRALSNLSDRELDDIGLGRGDIDYVAAGKPRF